MTKTCICFWIFKYLIHNLQWKFTGAAWLSMVRRGSVMVRRGSVGSASACCKAGPSSNPGSAPQGGHHNWVYERWRNGERLHRIATDKCIVRMWLNDCICVIKIRKINKTFKIYPIRSLRDCVKSRILWSSDFTMNYAYQSSPLVLKYHTGSGLEHVKIYADFSCIQWGMDIRQRTLKKIDRWQRGKSVQKLWRGFRINF